MQPARAVSVLLRGETSIIDVSDKNPTARLLRLARERSGVLRAKSEKNRANKKPMNTTKQFYGQRIWLFALALLVVPVLAGAQGGPPGGMQVTVESMVVTPSPLESTVDAVGTVLADASAVLRTEIPGQIVEQHFEEGQQVQQGDALLIIDPQNDFLSPDGVTWGVVGESVTANNTVENLEKLFNY